MSEESIEGDDATEFEALQAAFSDAFAVALTQHRYGGLPVKFLALVEVIDNDGDQYLMTMGSRSLTPWDKLGMLTYALQTEQAGASTFQIVGGFEDDDD